MKVPSSSSETSAPRSCNSAHHHRRPVGRYWLAPDHSCRFRSLQYRCRAFRYSVHLYLCLPSLFEYLAKTVQTLVEAVEFRPEQEFHPHFGLTLIPRWFCERLRRAERQRSRRRLSRSLLEKIEGECSVLEIP